MKNFMLVNLASYVHTYVAMRHAYERRVRSYSLSRKFNHEYIFLADILCSYVAIVIRSGIMYTKMILYCSIELFI